MKKSAVPLPVPPHIVYHEKVETENGEFVIGESVWVDGWRKSPSSENRILRIITNLQAGENPEVFVNIFCLHRGRGQTHSVLASRLVKRKEPKRRKKNV
jgi:hypothetical protein